MDCRISFKNASTLDKLCSVFKSSYLVIDTRQNVNFQLVSDSKNIVSNLTLNISFFEECQLKNMILKINKPRFSYAKMISLRIETTQSFLIFEYEFEDYVYRHRYVIFEGSLYQVPFVINRSDYIDSFLLYQVISQTSGQAKIKFDDSCSEVYNENINLKFICTGFSGITFNFESDTFKNILSNNDLFDSCLLNWEDNESPINMNFYGTTISAFYFLAT
ncbi:hypothetical protein P3W45_001227 [Vairimorpha bombi]